MEDRNLMHFNLIMQGSLLTAERKGRAGCNCTFDHCGKKPPSLSALWMGELHEWGEKTSYYAFFPFTGLKLVYFYCSLDLNFYFFIWLVLNFTTGFCSLELFSVERKCISARVLFKFNLLLSATVLKTSLKCEQCACSRGVWVNAHFFEWKITLAWKGLLSFCLKVHVVV